MLGERERLKCGKYYAFGFLHVRLGLCLPDELAQLVHLPKRHLSEWAEAKQNRGSVTHTHTHT